MGAERMLAVVEITADPSGVQAGLRQADSALTRFHLRAKKALTVNPSSVFKGIGAGAAGAAVGILHLANQTYEFEDGLTRMAIGAGLSAKQMNEMRAAIDKTSSATGMSRDTVRDAAIELNALLGPAGASADKMELVAKASQASGESAKALAGVIFSVNEAFGLLETQDQEKALSAFIEAGKAGSVPLQEMSVVLQQVGAQWSKVAGQGVEGAADLAAAIQAARGGFGSAAEVGTGLKAFVGALTQNAGKFKAAGVKLFDTLPDGSKRLKEIRTVLDQLGKSKLVKDPTKLQAAFGSSEALQFFEILSKNRDKYEEIYDLSLRSDAVQTDSQKYLNSAAGQYAKSLNDVKQAVSQAFDPAFLKDFSVVLGGALETIKLMIAGLRSMREGFEEFLGMQELDKANEEREKGNYLLAEQAAMQGADARDVVEIAQQSLKATIPAGSAGAGAATRYGSTAEKLRALVAAIPQAAQLRQERIARLAREAGIVDERGNVDAAKANEVFALGNTGQTADERWANETLAGFGDMTNPMARMNRTMAAEETKRLQEQQIQAVRVAVESTVKVDPNGLLRAETSQARQR